MLEFDSREFTKYNLEYKGVTCTGVNWKTKDFLFRDADGKNWIFHSKLNYDCTADTDHIRCVIEDEFLHKAEKKDVEENQSAGNTITDEINYSKKMVDWVRGEVTPDDIVKSLTICADGDYAICEDCYYKSDCMNNNRGQHILIDAADCIKILSSALNKAVELAYEYRTEADTLSCSSCPMEHIFDKCKDRGLYKDCSNRWKEELIRQATEEVLRQSHDDKR